MQAQCQGEARPYTNPNRSQFPLQAGRRLFHPQVHKLNPRITAGLLLLPSSSKALPFGQVSTEHHGAAHPSTILLEAQRWVKPIKAPFLSSNSLASFCLTDPHPLLGLGLIYRNNWEQALRVLRLQEPAGYCSKGSLPAPQPLQGAYGEQERPRCLPKSFLISRPAPASPSISRQIYLSALCEAEGEVTTRATR